MVTSCGVLREQSVVAEPAPASGPIADKLQRFDKHMRGVQGLADKTRNARVRVVQRLLLQRFAGRRVVIAGLQPGGVRQFIADQLEYRGTASNARARASALRAYFRRSRAATERLSDIKRVLGHERPWGRPPADQKI